MAKGHQPGAPKTPGSGRKKGSLNKKTEELHEICQRLDLNPFEAMAKIALDQGHDVGLRLNALKELCQYLYSKRKSLEHSGEINANPYAGKSVEELRQIMLEKLKIE